MPDDPHIAEQPSRRPRLKLTRPLILIACAGGGILLSCGLCGLAGGPMRQGSSAPLATVGIVLFLISLVCIVIGIFSLMVAAIINSDRR